MTAGVRHEVPMPRVLFALLFASAAVAADKPVKVFVLTGQSNMEGKAKVSLFDTQVKDPANKALFAPYRNGDAWAERDDVLVKFLDRKGKLTVGFGSPKCVGPELGFGWVVGDKYDEPVLLVKAAWGGRSLWRDFRSPSAGLPPEAKLNKMLTDMQKKTPTATLDDVKKPFGAAYRDMLKEVNEVLADAGKVFPELKGRKTELAGLVWFQGWNDMIDADATAEYAANLKHFITDVRKDLKAPDLPVVVGQMGVDGEKAGDGVKKFKAAQAEGVADKAFKGNVALVKTDAFWDTEAEAVFKKGWRENIDEWNKVGSDYPYHYLGSAKTMLAMGKAFGEAMLELKGEKK
jgi:alpha-galactosidase